MLSYCENVTCEHNLNSATSEISWSGIEICDGSFEVPITEITIRTFDRASFPSPTGRGRNPCAKNRYIGTVKGGEYITFWVHDKQNVTKVSPRRTRSVIEIDPIQVHRKVFAELFQVNEPV